MSSGFIRHNLSIGEAMSRAGVKGGRIPDFANSIVPVMLVANFSNTYSGEPLEARGVAGRSEGTAAGQRALIRLHSLAPGGIVVERLIILGFGANGGWLDVLNEAVPTTVEAEAFVLDVGGADAVSRVITGDTVEVGTGAGPIDLSYLGVLDASRVYVPPGSILTIVAQDAAGGGLGPWDWQMIWREIPAPIALP